MIEILWFYRRGVGFYHQVLDGVRIEWVRIRNERNATKKLIEIFEQKIKDKIGEVWAE